MTDFYALLKQSIIERDIRHPEDRKAVYLQAREAVIKQLWAFRPPLAAHEIDTRIGAYDNAVERIEADLAVAFADGETPERLSQRRSSPTPPEILEDEEPPTSDLPRGEGDDEAPPLADWREHGRDDEAEEPDYERGVPRARAESEHAPVEPVEEAADEEVLYAYDEPDEAPDTAERGWWRRTEAVEPADEAPVPWWRVVGERHGVQILGGAIAAMVIALGAFGAYFYLSRGSEDVTTPISVRREVSDAATAVRIAEDKVAVTQSYAVFEGADPTIFATTPDNPVHFDAAGGFVRVSSSASAPGVKAAIGPGLAARLAGQNVRVVILARSSTELGAASMRFAYQSGVAISHWQTANVAADYESVGLVWRVPTMRTSPTDDYLVIEPGIPGDGTGVDIKSIRIDVLAESGS